MTAPHDNTILEAARERAVFWRVRLASESATEDDWLAFETWLAADPAHRSAYELVEQVWDELDAAPGSARSNLLVRRPRPHRRAVLTGAVAASVAAAAAVGAGLWRLQPNTQVFDTAPGEQGRVTLADGTRITINGGSHLTATLGRRERRVVMADAEAVFDVARDPGRPFLIEAGEREIRVVGTEFNVLHHRGRLAVAVRRGVVEVRPKAAPEAAGTRLVRGQVLIHRRGQAGDHIAPVDPDAALAWTTGRLVFQNERLVEVAAALDRYGTQPILVEPDARDLRVTAVLEIGSQDAMLGSLAQFMPVRVDRRADSIRLSARR